MTKICIVGANGYVGRALTVSLRQTGADVLALSSSDGTGINPVTGLLPKELQLDGVETVVYAAQSPHYRQMPDMAWHLQAVNCVSAVRAATAAVQAGAKRFVYLSTGTVYAPSFEPLNESAPVSGSQWYPLSKLQGEHSVSMLANCLDVHLVRIFAIYGPEQTDKLVPRLCASVDEGRQLTLSFRQAGQPDGGLRLNPCYIDDAVRALTDLAHRGGPRVMNLAGPQVVSVRDIAETWARLRGRQVLLVPDRAIRPFDLIADDSLLRAWAGRPFLSVDEGLARMAAHTASASGH
jgi:nucleoside-diphosphate-sugar epimerase